MIAFPDSASVAAAATQCSASRGQWSEMLLAARAWRTRTAADSDHVSADIAAARALLRLDRPGEALALLRPWLAGKASPASRLTLEGITCYAEALCATGEVGQAAQLLLPSAREEPLFRAAAIRLAAEQLDKKNGRQWLEQLESLSDIQSTDQAATLGRAWATLAARNAGNAECLERAKRCFDVVRAGGDKSAFALEEAAIFAERMGDAAAAIDLYRRALSVDPKRPVSLNELACLLVANGEQLADAKKFADAAVAIAPEEPEFLDTLATVQVKSHDYAAAQQLLRRAAQLDPENARWRIVLAQLLLDGGKRDEAAKTVDAIDASGTDLSKLPEPLRKQLNQLRMLTSPASNSKDVGPAAAAK
jgi:predicted Zn-dependent protease